MEHFYRVREEKYSDKTSRFYPEYKYDKFDTWHNMAFKMYGYNENGWNYCTELDDAINIATKMKHGLMNGDSTIIEEKIHKVG